MQEENILDKRPWLMDYLMEIGQDMAIINHCCEKLQYLKKDLENAENEDAIDIIAKKQDHFYQVKEKAYDSYNLKMTEIFDIIPNSNKDCRCLLKHACFKVTLAMEGLDARPTNPVVQTNLDLAFDLFAMAVSLAIGIDFHDCVRCIYDGVKEVSEKNKKVVSL